MEFIASALVVLFFIFLVLTGNVSGALKTAIWAVIFGMIIYFLGKVFIFFLPLIIILYILNLFNRKKYNNSRFFRYERYTAEDFEEFFRKTQSGYSNGGYSYQNTGYNGNFGYQEDLTKYYDVLGVSKTSSKEEIKRAYRELVKQHHPDRYANSSENDKKYHENRLKEINEAYEKLNKE